MDPPAKNAALEKRLQITSYHIYSDRGGAASRAFKVYDPHTEIAIAATFVIDRGGEVLFRYVGSDKSDRPSVETIVGALRQPDGKAPAGKPGE